MSYFKQRVFTLNIIKVHSRDLLERKPVFFNNSLYLTSYSCQTSPRCCSRGSPGGWIKNLFYKTGI